MTVPSLSGKVALVTGASRGIGRAIAQRFASAGATVVVTARSLDAATQMPGTLAETVGIIEAAGGRAIPLAADLETAAERDSLVQRTVAAAGALDILVNNAGFAHYERMETLPLAMFDRTIEHYLRVPFVLSQAAIPHMRRRGAGWILNLGSSEAQPPLRPYGDRYKKSGGNFYGAIKAALARMTQGLAAELQDDNIAVNLVAPSGAISTPGAERLIPKGYRTEPVEYLAEVALALCHLPAAERTGLVTYALHYAFSQKLQAYSLDGRDKLPPAELPEWTHPAIKPDGIYP
jgi:NAD(P)-dependent dehydrogenase (short-subunit alcohol dehydrogenase family)